MALGYGLPHIYIYLTGLINRTAGSQASLLLIHFIDHLATAAYESKSHKVLPVSRLLSASRSYLGFRISRCMSRLPCGTW